MYNLVNAIYICQITTPDNHIIMSAHKQYPDIKAIVALYEHRVGKPKEFNDYRYKVDLIEVED